MSAERSVIETAGWAPPPAEAAEAAPALLIRSPRRAGRIAAVLPRGETIRNFVYSGALDEVAERAEVSLLSVIPGDDFKEFLSGRFDSLSQLGDVPERWLVRQIQELRDMAHGRWLWSQAAQQRWRLRDAEADSPRKRALRSLRKLACYPFANRRGVELITRLECAASRKLRPTEEYVRLWRRLRPSLVFNASHIHSRNAAQAVHAAQALKIPTATFIFSWDNLTSQGRLVPFYDYYLVWNERIKRQLLDIYPAIRPEQVFVTGTPQFDFHFRPEFYKSREEFCAEIGADPARPLVLYSTGMANHMLKEEVVVERLAAMLEGMTELGPPQLVVRVYAKDQTGRFDEIKKRCPGVLFPPVPWAATWQTPCYEDSYMLTNLLRHSDLGINVASTITLELCMFDKPVINVAYRPAGADISAEEFDYRKYYDFEHYVPVVKSGAVMLAEDEREMPGLIRRALTDPRALSSQRNSFIEEMFGPTLRDGRSARRVAHTLLKLAGH